MCDFVGRMVHYGAVVGGDKERVCRAAVITLVNDDDTVSLLVHHPAYRAKNASEASIVAPNTLPRCGFHCVCRGSAPVLQRSPTCSSFFLPTCGRRSSTSSGSASIPPGQRS